MAAHSRILAWRFPWTTGARWATVHRATESDVTEAMHQAGGRLVMFSCPQVEVSIHDPQSNKDGEACLLGAEAVWIILCVRFQKVTQGAGCQQVRHCGDFGMRLSAERFLQWPTWTEVVS